MPQQELCRVYSLLFRAVCTIALHPADVKITVIRTAEGATFQISANPEDLRNIVGQGGGIARSFTVLISGIGLRAGQHYRLSLERFPETSGGGPQPCSEGAVQNAS